MIVKPCKDGIIPDICNTYGYPLELLQWLGDRNRECHTEDIDHEVIETKINKPKLIENGT